MVKGKEPKKFACLECGTPYDAHPPDDGHNTALLEPCKSGDSVEVKYMCTRCSHKNIIHWDSYHSVVVGRSF